MPRIAHLAGQQSGNVARRQLLRLGVTPDDIRHRVNDGTLIVIHRGVYALLYRRPEQISAAWAAVLACGPEALLGSDSTLALYGLRRWPPIPEVIVPAARRVRRPGIRVRRSTTLTAADRGLWLGVPTTHPARAIADMGHRLTEAQRVRLVNNARLAHHLSVDEQARLLGHDRNPTRSAGEDLLGRWLRAGDLPQPLVNAVVNGHEVDAHYPEAKVVLQLDHPATHSDPHTFAADRRHDRRDAELGWLTVRLTTDDLTAEEADRLRRLLHDRHREHEHGRAPDPPGGSH